jgi:hypothetical protein
MGCVLIFCNITNLSTPKRRKSLDEKEGGSLVESQGGFNTKQGPNVIFFKRYKKQESSKNPMHKFTFLLLLYIWGWKKGESMDIEKRKAMNVPSG